MHKKLTANCHSGLDPESKTPVNLMLIIKDSEMNSELQYIGYYYERLYSARKCTRRI